MHEVHLTKKSTRTPKLDEPRRNDARRVLPCRAIGPISEVELSAKFDQAAGQNGLRLQPRRPETGLQDDHVGRIGDIVDVEIPLHARTAQPEDLAQTDVELVAAWLEQRVGFD